jgi:hypothetical protein
MEVSVHDSIWDSVRELTQVAQRKGSDPLLWALQLSSSLSSAGVALPSVELADVLVSYICWDNNLPILWKFLEKALMLRIVPPMLVLALLSVRFCGFLGFALFWFFVQVFRVFGGYSLVGTRESV